VDQPVNFQPNLKPHINPMGNAVLTVLIQNAAYNEQGRDFIEQLQGMAAGADTCLDVQVLGDLHNSHAGEYDRDIATTDLERKAVKQAQDFSRQLLSALIALGAITSGADLKAE